MITFSKGDLLQSGAEAVINTVNCVGVMGKGIALQFKQAFPATMMRTGAPATRAKYVWARCSSSIPEA